MKTIKDTGCCSFPTKEPEFKLQVKEGNSEFGKAIQYSVVKWQTGEPKESGSYLVTIKGTHGTFVECCYSCFSMLSHWSWNNVIAWCKLSDIEPYKEEEV